MAWCGKTTSAFECFTSPTEKKQRTPKDHHVPHENLGYGCGVYPCLKTNTLIVGYNLINTKSLQQ